MKRLLDTSVWIAWQRGEDRAVGSQVRAMIVEGWEDLVGCGPIRMELSMAASDSTRTRITRVYSGMPSLALTEEDFDAAADIFRLVQRSGHTVRSGIDCLIAAIAVRHGALLVHADRDYDRIGDVVSDLEHQHL